MAFDDLDSSVGSSWDLGDRLLDDTAGIRFELVLGLEGREPWHPYVREVPDIEGYEFRVADACLLGCPLKRRLRAG